MSKWENVFQLSRGYYGKPIKFKVEDNYIGRCVSEYVIKIVTDEGELKVYGFVQDYHKYGSKTKLGWIHKGAWISEYNKLTKYYEAKRKEEHKKYKEMDIESNKRKKEKEMRIKEAFKKK